LKGIAFLVGVPIQLFRRTVLNWSTVLNLRIGLRAGTEERMKDGNA
jgi:hypothetical protein